MKFRIPLLGQFEINYRKSYKQLSDVIAREKSASIKDPKTNATTQLREYKSWVSICVSLISDSVSMNDYKFYRSDTMEEVRSNIHGYNIFTKPFTYPNKYMTFRSLKAWCQTQLDLCGMAMIFKARNRLGQIWELWPLNMNDFVYAVDNDGHRIEFSGSLMPEDINYIFNVNGQHYAFSLVNDLIVLQYPHPLYKFLGASPIQQQAYAVDIETYVEVYERDFFSNSARPDFALISDHDITPEIADSYKQRWREIYVGNYHDVAVLGSGFKPEKLNFTNKDFAFLELSQWSKAKVFGAYKVPQSKGGGGMGTSKDRKEYVYSDISYARECVNPRLNLWDEELTKEILAHYDSRIILKHENPIPRDRELEVKEARVYLAGASSHRINEVRELHKLEKDPNGEVILVPTSLIPLSLLEKYWKAQIKNTEASAKRSNLNQTDPTRHSNDDPHIQPSGTDDRDTNPTPGRSFSDFEKNIREPFLNRMEEIYKTFDPEGNESKQNEFLITCKSLVKLCLQLLNQKDIKFENDWILSFSDKTEKEFRKTILTEWKNKNIKDNWEVYLESQIKSNPRVAKICNSMVNSCITYAKFLVLEKYGLERQWIVNRNECGHKGRVLNFVTSDVFKIGDTKVRFPGENLNLSCDCTLDVYRQNLLEKQRDD